ncbi:uncharacterized protein UV8b_05412 [Ustilaginoidea virens]|uniref:Uncharacterized protein n=1 Tax=Ustilaginoidea virens TaxID=1159556 RepID=A0A8E5HT61_USTVR|nr:uncharacterized protein UV8b_05412 [Ustilaginoidea virens]QUC21169.1 hypothetical protein UV8b_05412 [Ustilaginoidea virens]
MPGAKLIVEARHGMQRWRQFVADEVSRGGRTLKTEVDVVVRQRTNIACLDTANNRFRTTNESRRTWRKSATERPREQQSSRN